MISKRSYWLTRSNSKIITKDQMKAIVAEVAKKKKCPTCGGVLVPGYFVDRSSADMVAGIRCDSCGAEGEASTKRCFKTDPKLKFRKQLMASLKGYPKRVARELMRDKKK